MCSTIFSHDTGGSVPLSIASLITPPFRASGRIMSSVMFLG